jgi:hypothetical protein
LHGALSCGLLHDRDIAAQSGLGRHALKRVALGCELEELPLTKDGVVVAVCGRCRPCCVGLATLWMQAISYQETTYCYVSCQQQESCRSSSSVVVKLYIPRSIVLEFPEMAVAYVEARSTHAQCFAKEMHWERIVGGQKVVLTCRCTSRPLASALAYAVG